MSEPFYSSLLSSKPVARMVIMTDPIKRDDLGSVETITESAEDEADATVRASQSKSRQAYDAYQNYYRARTGGNPLQIRQASLALRQAIETDLRSKGFTTLGNFSSWKLPILALMLIATVSFGYALYRKT